MEEITEFETSIDYWESLVPKRKKALAEAVGTTVNVLSQIAHGHAKCSAERANDIHRETGGKWSREFILPAIFKEPV